MKSIEEIKEWKKQGKIAIFCAGKNGYTFYRILQLVGVQTDCFVDNNQDIWNTIMYGEISCYSPEFLEEKEEFITFICINPEYYSVILKQTIELKIVHIESVYDIIKDIVRNYQDVYKRLVSELPYAKTSEVFYKYNFNEEYKTLEKIISNEEKLVVYTSIFGAYDTIQEPEYISENIDYFFISDEKPKDLKVYKWLNVKDIVPKEIENPVLKNRYVKMHPHLIFSEYKYSIYVDGNVQILKDLSVFIQKNKLGISVFKHPYREDVFIEALAVVNAKRAEAKDVYEQMRVYFEEKMPFNYGLTEMRIIAREHHNTICIKIMEDWWREFINTKSQRDQLSFMYVIWKNGYKLSDLFLLGEDMRNLDYILVNNHKA